MNSAITQCPHCHTRFRVSQDQLDMAQGVVRCGACMEVFDGTQYLHGRDEAEQAQSTPADTGPATGADATLWIHDDLDLDSLDLDEELAKLEQQEMRLSRDVLDPEHAANLPPVTADVPGSHDQSWAEKLLEDAGPATPRAAPPSTVDEPPAATAPSVDASEEEGISAIEARQATKRHGPGMAAQALFELDDEPLQLDWQPQRNPWGRRLAWGALILLALLALAGQYVVYNFDELARQDGYRPWLERLCPTLGCTLPAKVDISQIKSSNLVVRSHPDFQGALVIDAILYNRAPFSQPFPLLELRFADRNGQLLANRRFKPGEYLAGELAGRTEMPSQTPIHIALDILDPGPKAVNYSLSFHSPE